MVLADELHLSASKDNSAHSSDQEGEAAMSSTYRHDKETQLSGNSSTCSSSASSHSGRHLKHVTRGRKTEEWLDGYPDWAHIRTVNWTNVTNAMIYLWYTIHFHGAVFLAICISHLLRMVIHPKEKEETVQLLTVIARHKLDVMRLAATRDYVAIFRKWIRKEELMDGRWMLYTLDRFTATFVKMPKDERHYQAKESPFLYIDHYNLAEQIAVVPLQEFIEYSLSTIGKPKGKVLLMCNSGRAGTTLLAQMLQLDGLTMSFSEPDPMFAVGHLVQEQAFGSEIEAYVPLLRAVMNASCKNQQADITYVFKPRCFSNAMLQLVTVSVPYVKQMFLYRVDTNAAVRSMIRSFMSRTVLAGLYEWKNMGLLWLDRLWITGSCIEKPALRAVKPHNLWEYGAVILAVQYTYLLDTHAGDESVLKMTYEELMADPHASMVRICELMNWPLSCIKGSMDCMKHDSQEKSPLSRKRLAVHEAAKLPITEKRAREIAYILRLPSDFIMPGFQFNHNEHLRSMTD